MGRPPCCDEVGLKKGPWTPEEDKKLIDYILTHGHHNWRNLPKSAGLNRCGKSCRLRWTNYLRPDIKRGKFSDEEERQIIHLHSVLGNKWSSMATHLPGRTDNEIKNYWNTHIKKKLLLMGIDPVTHRQITDLELLANLPALLGVTANLGIPSWDNVLRLQTDAANIARFQIIQSLVQIIGTPCPSQSIHPMNQLGSALQNYQLNDFVLANGSLSMPQNAIPTSIPLPTNSSQPLAINFQTLCESSLPEMDQMHDPYLVPTASSSAPSLVSASSENLTADDMQDSTIKSNHIFPTLSVSTPFDSWKGQELGDLDIDLGWKDILDQLSWSSA